MSFIAPTYNTILYYFILVFLLLPINSFASEHLVYSTKQVTDTICTNNTRDTIATLTVDKATSYNWQLPQGAIIVEQLSDTFIIVDWQNTTIGTTSLCVMASNDCGESTPFCSDIYIEHCNTPPQAQPDLQSTFFGIPATIFVQNNDVDPDGNDLITLIDSTALPINGTISLSNDAIVYTPDEGFTGLDSFQYIICDTGIPIQCDSNIVRVVVDHQAPTGTNDLITTPSNSSISIPVLNNDSDPEGSTLAIAIDTSALPINGSLQLVDEEMVYTPNDGFTGTDRFEYIVCDSNDPVKCDNATVTVTVLNQAPLAVDDNYKIPAGTSNSLLVLANDSDKENGQLTVSIANVQTPLNGILSTNGIEVEYTPNQGFTGRDSFEYVICDDGIPSLCDTANVSIQIVNDAPIAADDFQTLPSNSTVVIEVLANDSDLEEGMLAVQLHPTDTSKHGTVAVVDNQIQYVPTDNFSGNDTLQYFICDNGTPVQCDTATIFIMVQNSPPIAQEDQIELLSGDTICHPVLENAFDKEGGNLDLSVFNGSMPNNGIVQIIDQEICYIPDSGFSGMDSLLYSVCDDGMPIQCDTALLVVTIINQAPVAIADTVSVVSNEEVCIAVIANDLDAENGELSITLDVSKLPKNGIATIQENNICYQPNERFSGLDSLCYIVCDNGIPVQCDTATIRITVENIAPIANDDFTNIISGEEICVAVTANDIDQEEGMFILSLDDNKAPIQGSVIIKDGEVCYTPDENFSGQDSLCYIICDDGMPAKCDTATLFINVSNQAPKAQDDLVETISETTITIPILNNDTDPENRPLTISLDSLQLPENGTVIIRDQMIEYTPDSGFTGVDEMDYIICDEGNPSLCDTATVLVTILNQAPEAMEDIVVISSGEEVCIEVLENDLDPEFGFVSVTLDATKLPQNGTVRLEGDDICYTPSSDFSGADSLCYIICDDGLPQACDTAQIFITIDNQAPIAVDDNEVVNSNEEVCVDVLLNDVDIEAGDLAITLDENKLPIHGAASVEDGKVCYVPEENFSGLDSLCYIICDDGIPAKCDTATLLVNTINLPPTAEVDMAMGLSDEEIEILVLANDTDPENGKLSISTDPSNLPEHGSIQILGDLVVYMPNEGYTGEDAFDYIICDDGTPSLCDTSTVLITVQNQAPIANEDLATTPSDNPISIAILQNDMDPENGNLAISINPNFLPSDGSLELINDSIIYTPFRGFNGDDAFEYIICDDGQPSLCDTALIRILILNNAPIAVEDIFTTPSNTSIVVDVINNDYDPENGQLSTTLVPDVLPKNGTIQIERGNFIYFPNLNYTGVDSFDYVLCDDGVPMQCDTTTVTIIIENQAPTADPDEVITTFETPINISYVANDRDPEEGNLTVLDSPEIIPENGTIIVEDNQLIYTPNDGFTGIDKFSYLLCDDGLPIQCDTALITVIVPNTKPIAIDDYVIMPCVPSIMIGVLGNDTDAEHNQFTLSLDMAKLPLNGTAVIIGDSIRYAPNELFVGIDSFDYIICDTGMPILCDTATVFIQVNNDPPNAVNDTFNILEDQLLISTVLSNDSDPNNHPIVVLDSLLTKPTLGTISLLPNGELNFQPYANLHGRDSLIYVICDEVVASACDTATVYIEIAALPDAPLATDDINITLKNVGVTGDVLINDSDPDKDELLVQPLPLTDPQFGTVILNADGSYIYTPTLDFVGEDYFTYEVCDDSTPSLCDTAMVQIIVVDENSDDNRPPLGVNDYILSTINTTIASNILANDDDPDGDIIAINTTPIELPSSGKLSLSSDGQIQYQPEEDFTGVVTFSYIVFDLGSPTLMDTAIVTIEILPTPDNSVFAVDDAFLGLEDNTITGNILVNDFDPEGDDLSILSSPIQAPQNGTVILQEDGTFLYAPKPDYFGPDYFIYEVCDNNLATECDEATVVLTILPVNDTLCSTALPLPTIVTNKTVCLNDTIHLFTPDAYPPIVLEEPDSSFQFIWFNGAGDTIDITQHSELFIAANDPRAIVPFSMKAQQGVCFSGFSNFLNIDITQNPTISITSDKLTTAICQEESIQLSTQFLSDVRYEWTIKGSNNILSTSEELAILELDSTTTFVVTVASTTCDLSTTDSVTISILSKPEASIVIAADSVICEGGSIVLSAIAESFTDYKYYWTGPKDYASNALSPIVKNVTVENNGTYQLVVENELGCQSDIMSILVDRVQAPLSPPTIIGEEISCSNTPLQLSILEATLSATTIEWINGDGTIIGNGSTITLESDSPLIITPFRARVIKEGCASSFSDPFFTNTFEPLTAEIISSNNAICKGSTTQLSAKSFDQAIYEWRRLESNTLFSTEQSTILANIQNELAVELTVYHEACPNSQVKDTLYLSFESNINFQPTASFVLNGDCSPTNLTLDANIPTDHLLVEWIGPNGFQSNLPSITIEDVNSEYNGTYEVAVTDSTGCISTATLFINDLRESLRRPIISSVEGAVCENSNILLEAPSYEGNEVRYEWYEDGELVQNETSNRLFINDAQIGNTYSLLLEVDGCSIESDPFTPIVLEKPIVTIGNSPEVACPIGDQSISIPTSIIGGQAPYEVSWIGPDNFVSSIPSPIINQATSKNAGTYEIKVTDQNDCQAFAFTDISIKDGFPIPSIKQEGGNCDGDAINLTAPLYEGKQVVYNWLINGEIIPEERSSLLNISLENGLNNEYQLVVEVDSCTFTSDPYTPQANSMASITSITNSGIYCEGEDVILSAYGNNVTEQSIEYTWRGPNGFEFINTTTSDSFLLQLPSINQSQAGSYTLSLRIGDCESDPKSTLVTVNNAVITPTLEIVESTVCAGDQLLLLANSITNLPTVYEWYLEKPSGDLDLVASTTTPNLVINNATHIHSGTYMVRSKSEGCISNFSNSQSVIVFDNEAEITLFSNATEEQPGCLGSSIQLSVPFYPDVTYKWFGPAGFQSTKHNPAIENSTHLNEGEYFVILTIDDCTSIRSKPVTVKLIEVPATPIATNYGPICVGEELDVKVVNDNNYNSSTIFRWYDLNNSLIAETNTPQISITEIPDNFSGDLYVIASTDGCDSEQSSPMEIVISQGAEVKANAGEDQEFCAISIAFLNASEPVTGQGRWTAISNGLIEEINMASTAVQNLRDGSNLFVWTVSDPICGSVSSDTTEIFVRMSTSDRAIAGLDQQQCERNTTQLNATPLVEAEGRWTQSADQISQGIIITSPTSPTTDVTGLIPGDTYQFNWIISLSDCDDFDADQVIIQVDNIPDEQASIPLSEIALCEENVIQLEAELPISSTGKWSVIDQDTGPATTPSATSIQISNPSSPTSFVEGLNLGENILIWTLSNGSCENFSNDTLRIVNQLSSIKNITKTATYCEGEEVLLTAQSGSPHGLPIEYTWRGPNGFEFVNTTTSDSFPLQIPAISENQAGSYTLSLRAGECVSEDQSVFVAVNPSLYTPALEVEERTICSGNQLSFRATVMTNSAVMYEWYLEKSSGEVALFERTNTPDLVIDNATNIHSGTYMVRMVSEDCNSGFSNKQHILVMDVETEITPFSNATEEVPGCIGSPIQLSVPFYPNVTYEWFGPAGFQSDRHNPIIENSTELDEGDYFVVIRAEDCTNIVSNTIFVKLNDRPANPITTSNSPICFGEQLIVNVINANNYNSSTTFHWYDLNRTLIVETQSPQIPIPDVPIDFSGDLYVVANSGGCDSEASSPMKIVISNAEEVLADAGRDQQFCSINTAFLNATVPETGHGEWTALSGGQIVDFEEASTAVQNLQNGSNLFVWTVSDSICGTVTTDTVEVFVGVATQDRAIAGSDQQLCETSSVQLNATPLIESEGRWMQSSDQISEGVTIMSPASPTTEIRGLIPGNTYQFNWIISTDNCVDFDADQVIIQIDDIPDERAVIPNEQISLCGEDQVQIEAVLPVFSIGKWSQVLSTSEPDATPPNTTINIANASSASTFIEGIPNGEHLFIWSLSNGGCENFSTDTLQIIKQGTLAVNADDFIINFNDSITLPILENDEIANIENTQLIITRHPEFGTVEEKADGSVLYTPNQNYFGRDFFRYKICNNYCEEVCDTAIVNLAITGVEGSGACFIPNTISPNNDGSNDQFLIACLDDFPDNQLSIYNRWGDKVFEAAPYQNNWQGEFERQPLPAGTYFYVLKLTNEGAPLQGFISLFR